jgi:hypothetical protein
MSNIVKWSDNQRLQAVIEYKSTGSIRETSRITGIPTTTIGQWKNEDWWKELEQELNDQARAKTTGQLESVKELAFEQLLDRLESGDYLFDQKTGKVIRKPVAAHVANRILQDSIEKQTLIEKSRQDERQHMTAEKISERLIKLHDYFVKHARKRHQEPSGEVLEMTQVGEHYEAIKGEENAETIDSSDQGLVQEATSEADSQSGV